MFIKDQSLDDDDHNVDTITIFCTFNVYSDKV